MKIHNKHKHNNNNNFLSISKYHILSDNILIYFFDIQLFNFLFVFYICLYESVCNQCKKTFKIYCICLIIFLNEIVPVHVSIIFSTNTMFQAQKRLEYWNSFEINYIFEYIIIILKLSIRSIDNFLKIWYKLNTTHSPSIVNTKTILQQSQQFQHFTTQNFEYKAISKHSQQ